MAAYFAFTQNDIKRVLAYSTISQLGYMMIGLGCGGVIVSHGREELLAVGYTAGMFHLMTHAFFKGLLFLGSGAVIYACHHEQDMRRMGGLLKLAPITAWTYIIGTLALMGIPGFAGFFSKDTILEAALEFNPLIFAAAVLGAGMTAAYMTRQLIMVFGGEYAGGHGHAHDDHAHDDHSHAHAELPSDPPWVMTGPLVVLAVLAVLSGFVGIPGNWPVSMKIAGFLEYHREGFTHGEHALNPVVMGCGTAAAFIGILVGRLAYDPQTREFRFATQRPTALDRFLYELSYNKGWFDELYRATLVNGMFFASRVCNLMDRYVVDGFVNALGWLTRQGAYACGLIDRFIVDGLVNLTAVIARGLGRGLRLGQSGQVQTYLLIVFVGLVALIGALAAGGTLGR